VSTPQFRPHLIGLVVTSAWLLAACGSAPSSGPASALSAAPSPFTDRITNQYFPLRTGTYVYDGTKDSARMHIETKVTTARKTVVGVRTVEIHDLVFVDDKLEEDTFDWYAQDAQGSVWYFGENTRELDAKGHVVSTKGTWLAGVNGAQPGIVMSAQPAAGKTYQQEYARGVAEDRARVMKTDASVAVPTGGYRDVIETEDTTPLEPDKLEHKWYAPGVGFVAGEMVRGGAEHIELTRFEQG
jgi:hypothetical protein